MENNRSSVVGTIEDNNESAMFAGENALTEVFFIDISIANSPLWVSRNQQFCYLLDVRLFLIPYGL